MLKMTVFSTKRSSVIVLQMNTAMKKKNINKDFLEKGAKAILPDDIRIAAENSDKMEEKVKRSSSLKGYLKDLILLGNLVKDYWKGSYRNIEYKAIVVSGAVYCGVCQPQKDPVTLKQMD